MCLALSVVLLLLLLLVGGDGATTASVDSNVHFIEYIVYRIWVLLCYLSLVWLYNKISELLDHCALHDY